MRKYDVQEIDELRRLVSNKYLYGAYEGLSGSGWSRSYTESDKARVVEEQVRTHMLAGHAAEDLLASENMIAR